MYISTVFAFNAPQPHLNHQQIENGENAKNRTTAYQGILYRTCIETQVNNAYIDYNIICF